MTSVGTKNQGTREAWIKDTLKSLPAGLRILDAGAGEQQYKEYCGHLEYVSQDFAEYDGTGNRKGLQTKEWDYSKLDIVCDIINIPEPDGAFDVVLCSEVFEHLPEPILAITEFNRLLKEEGLLILTAPFCSLTHLAPYHYYSGYNQYFYEKILAEKNFEILELVSNGNFFEYIAQEILRIQSTAERYADDRPSLAERYALQFILKMLERFSNKDQGSEELLCYGYQVLCKKNK